MTRSIRIFSLTAIFFMSFALNQAVKAQNNRVSVESLSTHGTTGMTPECKAEATTFMSLAGRFPMTSNWHYVIICDEFTWKEFLRTHGQDQPGVQVYGVTYLQSKLTFIRGWALTHVDLTSGAPTPERIVAHEIGHVILNTNDDGAADRLATQWLKAANFPVYAIREAPAVVQPSAK